MEIAPVPQLTAPLRVLVGFSGSVATIKSRDLVTALVSDSTRIRVIFTAAAMRFVPPDDLAVIRSLCDGVFTDADEWTAQPSAETPEQEQRQRLQPAHSSPWRRGDAVLHIELRKWADVFLIAPLSANTLAKLAGGHCDNLLTCVARAWDFAQRRPLVVAPAMNTMMWTHALTADQLARIEAWGVTIVPPVAKTLACGDIGVGAMASIADICAAVLRNRNGCEAHLSVTDFSPQRCVARDTHSSLIPAAAAVGACVLAAIFLARGKR